MTGQNQDEAENNESTNKHNRGLNNEKQVTRGTENARRREGAPQSTRSHETAWNKLRKCRFFALQKNRPKSQPFTVIRPGPGPAGDFKFL